MTRQDAPSAVNSPGSVHTLMRSDVPRTLTTVATALAIALALEGCATSSSSGGGEPAPVPAGFQRFTEGAVSFVYPAGWRAERRPGEAASSLVGISPPGTPPDPSGAGQLVGFGRFQVSAPVEPSTSFDDHSFEQTGVYGRRLVGQEDVDVEGAEAARRFEYEYQDRERRTSMRKLDLVVIGPDRRTLYNLVAQAPAGAADKLEPAIESFRLEG